MGLAMRLIDDVQREIFRLWSMRLLIGQAAFWSALGGLWIMWPALVGAIPLIAYFIVGTALAILTGVARVTKQPGAK